MTKKLIMPHKKRMDSRDLLPKRLRPDRVGTYTNSVFEGIIMEDNSI